MIQIRDVNGNVVHTSRNLRGLLDQARRSPVRKVHWTGRPDGSAVLAVRYADGCHCETVFLSMLVCAKWCARRRNWPQATVTWPAGHLKGA
jgi:hypothetical protein